MQNEALQRWIKWSFASPWSLCLWEIGRRKGLGGSNYLVIYTNYQYEILNPTNLLLMDKINKVGWLCPTNFEG
jgi:hypothetical protein